MCRGSWDSAIRAQSAPRPASLMTAYLEGSILEMRARDERYIAGQMDVCRSVIYLRELHKFDRIARGLIMNLGKICVVTTVEESDENYSMNRLHVEVFLQKCPENSFLTSTIKLSIDFTNDRLPRDK